MKPTSTQPQPLVCTLLPAELRRRRARIVELVSGHALERRRTGEGHAVRFARDPDTIAGLANLVALEARCCPGLRLRLDVHPAGGPVWLEVLGPSGTDEWVETLLGRASVPPSLPPERRALGVALLATGSLCVLACALPLVGVTALASVAGYIELAGAGAAASALLVLGWPRLRRALC